MTVQDKHSNSGNLLKRLWAHCTCR